MILLKRRNSQKLTMCANFIALAFIFSYLESLFPFSLGIPGVKLGLANQTATTMVSLGTSILQTKAKSI